jgi:arsenite-transporting ATPase
LQRQRVLLMEALLPAWLNASHRYLFFTGKGGVGKTSLSCATAILLADQGQRTLLVSTDPASNLDQVLQTPIGQAPTPILGLDRLWALNIDPVKAAASYRERVVGPSRGLLPATVVAEIEEQLSGACTVEIAAFDEFSKLMTDAGVGARFDRIIFDTAPTGHTLRLLQLSAAWKGYLRSSTGDASCLGPLSGLKSHQEQFAMTLTALTDRTLSRLVLVARPDRHSLLEANRTSLELTALGMNDQRLIINGLLSLSEPEDSVARAMHQQMTAALGQIPLEIGSLPMSRIPLSPNSLIGIPSLRVLLTPQTQPVSAPVTATLPATPPNVMDFAQLVAGLEMKTGIIMTMGKGGVGKTTLASRLAVSLVARGLKVHLTTSDPAAHLDPSLENSNPGLRVSRIDPRLETESYRREVMEKSGLGMTEEARQLLQEDLRSPCTEEIAVFRAFARVVAEAQDKIVVLDTAPTGHTLLLLDATQAYQREIARNLSAQPGEMRELLPRLRDPRYTKVLIVTLPEATPVQEATDLQNDLKRAGIAPYAWIINQSLLPLAVNHPVLVSRRAREAEHVSRICGLTDKVALVPWQAMGQSNAAPF